jgi:23S rRNA pseudouridine1911/1915/1917 synthase
LELRRVPVPEPDAGVRLDVWLARLPEIESRAEAERLIAGGHVLVAGERQSKSHRLEGGETIELTLPDPPVLIGESLGLDIVYSDDHLMVVDKPAGLVTHPAGSHTTGTLVHGLLQFGAAGGDPSRPGIVHRLDRDTSGLLLVARSEDAHKALQELIRAREVERRYTALVKGSPRSRTGRIDAPIGRDRTSRLRRSLDTETPRNAVTLFEVERILGERALLEITLETGRTHQIRVHLEAIDLPVCGDPVYGIGGDLSLERQFLHAHGLSFTHPFTDERVDISSPLPADLVAALARAEAAAE